LGLGLTKKLTWAKWLKKNEWKVSWVSFFLAILAVALFFYGYYHPSVIVEKQTVTVTAYQVTTTQTFTLSTTTSVVVKYPNGTMISSP